MTDAPLEDLPFDELRQRAFHVAEHRLDLGFFVDVYSHMPGMVAIEGEGGDLGSTSGTIIESIRAFKQMFGDQFNPAMFDTPDARNGTLENLVAQRALSSYVMDNHLSVSDDTLRKTIAEIGGLKNADGSFDKERTALFSDRDRLTGPVTLRPCNRFHSATLER